MHCCVACANSGARLARPVNSPSARSSTASSTWRRPKRWPISSLHVRKPARAPRCSRWKACSRARSKLLQALIALRVHIEAAIDFPEEEIDFLADPAIGRQLAHVRGELAELLREAQRGLRLNDGLRVAIIGRPNAGKSSLLNALAGSDRAIVNATAGTTRDVLRESLSLDGIALELADTAGLRDTDDEVEREGVRRAHGELARADVALLVTDANLTRRVICRCLRNCHRKRRDAGAGQQDRSQPEFEHAT
jgi:tRNA U34 5-carboxymethylaminomethyl modifying GTPase MnmE/TrmE